MSTEAAILGIYFVGLGSGLCVWGMLHLRRARKAARALAAEAGECVCSARFASCICEIGGTRNPRGAGRGRIATLDGVRVRLRTPPNISKCKNLRAYGPSPCHYPTCDCFEVCGDEVRA